MFKVYVSFKDQQITLQSEENKVLLDLLRENEIDIPAPCGGKSKCGKCIVQVLSGKLNDVAAHEKDVLGKERINAGYRLSCMTKVLGDCSIIVPDFSNEATIMTDLSGVEFSGNGIVNKFTINLGKPNVHDQASDLERIQDKYGKCLFENNMRFLNQLPSLLRQSDFKVEMIFIDGMPADIPDQDSKKDYFGIAIDIGTTTVAVYLYDFVSKNPIDHVSFLNPQKPFGADVISRIDSCIQSEENLKRQSELVILHVNNAIGTLCKNNGVSTNDIYTMAFVGNTTMMHLFMGISPVNIASSPFIPVTVAMHRLKPSDLGITINPNGLIYALPCISGYVGADTVGAVYATGMHKNNKITVMCDIGTNGEIVLGNRDQLYTCSTAAGPAFEGANIKCGIGGVAGAIDKVKIDTDVVYTTIGNKKPTGICGSGIVDVIAEMLDEGIIDYTGRIVDQDELDETVPTAVADRIINFSGDNAFLLESASKTGTKEDIIITQKDVRELQNAKAAIAAGILILIKASGYTFDDIDAFYLAGGFGNYLKVSAACKIGLIPKELESKVKNAGNAAGAGALLFISSEDSVREVEDIKNKTEYIELSTNPDFSNQYIDCMFF
ncbi:MAG TPA: ferredoxin [Clostridiales bacterium]|nr:ferredoxin [Clostridiales bacterium]